MFNQESCADLMEFAYDSRVAAALPPAACLRLARRAWSFNRRMGLTGHLSLRDGRFLQVIEGPSEVVLPLAARILADRRHGSLTISAFGALDRRRYADWSMDGFEMDPLVETLARLPEIVCFDARSAAPARARKRLV